MKCDICGKKMKKKISHMGEPIFVCRKCKLRKIEGTSAIGREVECKYKGGLEQINSTRIFNFKIITKKILEFLSDEKDAKGLEIGSGLGLFLITAKEQGLQVTGIEPIEDNYNAAKKRGVNCKCGMFPQALSEEEIYDYIVFNDVYEHIPNTADAMQSVSNHLKEGGLLVINIPVSTGIVYRISSFLDNIGLKTGGALMRRLYQLDTSSPHLYYFNKKSLSLLGSKYNFRLLSSPLRMRTYSIKEVSKRVQYVKMNMNPVMEKLIMVVGMIFYPLICLLPRDTMCYIFVKEKK